MLKILSATVAPAVKLIFVGLLKYVAKLSAIKLFPAFADGNIPIIAGLFSIYLARALLAVFPISTSILVLFKFS